MNRFHVVRMANAALEAVRKGPQGCADAGRGVGSYDRSFAAQKRAAELTDRDLLLSGWTATIPRSRTPTMPGRSSVSDCTSSRVG